MTKIKVLDLAREVGMEDDKLLLKLRRMGVKVKDKKSEEPEKMKPLSDERVIERDSEKEVVEKRVKPTVIRRRTHHLEPKVESAPQVEILPPVEIPPPPPIVVEAEVQEKRPPKGAEEKEPKARAKGTRERKTAESQEVTPQAEATVEAKEAIPVKAEAKKAVPLSVPPQEAERRTEAKKEVQGPKIQEAKIKEPRVQEPKPKAPTEERPEVKPLEKKKLIEKEEMEALAVKKKGFVKKRRLIEERMLVEGEPSEEEVRVEKEAEPFLKPFRPMKKKVVVKEAKKTEVTVPKPIKRIIRIAEMITVGDLAKRMGVKGGELIKKLMAMGILVNINQTIDTDVASLVASEFGYEVEKVSLERQDLLERTDDLPEQLRTRPSVVTIMGHVDHGKTMLLDAIRKTNVVEGEAGGITQHIGAYDVELENSHVVFIDTPGHEAFTAMRARGAQVTDVVVLVVAADDGVMPQTREAIDHARAAKVPIVVAVNKMDKPSVNPEKVMKDLADYGLVPEKWGGNTLYAEVSAKQKKGIKELLELILLQSEMLELRANPDKPARGVIIEAKLDRGRGPVATVLVQEGTLKTGETFIAGSQFGRVRAMLNDKGQKIENAQPSIPVEVVGFSDVPEAGESFIVVSDERMARQISLHRQEKLREKELSKLSKVSLEDLYDQIKKGEVKELNVIIKADVQGSIEAMKEALRKLATEAVKVNILHDGVGGITETDVNLASASNAIIIGFNVRPMTNAQTLAEKERVDLRTYSIIYDAINDIKKAMEGLLEPTYREHFLGRAQVIQLFNIHKVGMIAGSLVLDGKVVRGSHARLLRDNVIIFDSRISSLKRFKDDMKDCGQGLECGIGIENFNDVKLGDIIESYEVEEIPSQLT
ncbi:MAG: translation initiation factor IF-2 [Deltaproteobacteria bacterium RBG_16_48_10]|nr:MAG: translation initiation factor IF-2 [Deltaproteobacteria bacterium RBG_16_48_10]